MPLDDSPQRLNVVTPQCSILAISPVPEGGEELLRWLERCGRVCYQSEDRATPDSARVFVRRLIDRGHESVLEHASVTVRWIVDRGLTHEIVRHRIASYSQESTRYCNYSQGRFLKQISVILPEEIVPDTPPYAVWRHAMETVAAAYANLIAFGLSPQIARAVLPTCLKAELIMTANLREWRHFFRLRCVPAAHPQLRRLSCDLLQQFQQRIPVVFDDLP